MSKLVLYEDPLLIIRLSEKPVSKGHIEVVPKKKAKLLSDLNDQETDHLFQTASHMASLLYQALGVHGTNIILNEGEEQLCVHIITRQEGDGLPFVWQPKQGNPAENKEVAKKVKDVIDYELWAEKNPEQAKKANNPVQTKAEEVKEEEGKENYLLKSLRRIP